VSHPQRAAMSAISRSRHFGPSRLLAEAPAAAARATRLPEPGRLRSDQGRALSKVREPACNFDTDRGHELPVGTGRPSKLSSAAPACDRGRAISRNRRFPFSMREPRPQRPTAFAFPLGPSGRAVWRRKDRAGRRRAAARRRPPVLRSARCRMRISPVAPLPREPRGWVLR